MPLPGHLYRLGLSKTGFQTLAKNEKTKMLGLDLQSYIADYLEWFGETEKVFIILLIGLFKKN